MLVLVTISFFMMRLADGGPFTGERAMHPETQAAIEARYGLDRPLHEQYLRFLGNVLQGDLGPSFVHKDLEVTAIIAQFLPVSLLLGGVAMLLALGCGIASGALAAARQNSFRDHSLMTLVMLGVSIPNFVVAPLLQWLFGIWLDWLPVAGWAGGWESLPFLVLPALTLAAPFAARIAGLTRAGMLEMIHQDFVRTAHAKGLHPLWVLFRHALPGALVPVLGFLGPAVASILTGSLVVEQIFAIPGLGREFVDAALNRDYTLVMGTVIIYGGILILANLLADLGLAVLDPRVRHGD